MPQNSFNVAEIEVVRESDAEHPAAKILNRRSAGAFWYNAADGVVRARVTWQGSTGATCDLYNRVNRSSVADSSIFGGTGGVVTPSW